MKSIEKRISDLEKSCKAPEPISVKITTTVVGNNLEVIREESRIVQVEAIR